MNKYNVKIVLLETYPLGMMKKTYRNLDWFVWAGSEVEAKQIAEASIRNAPNENVTKLELGKAVLCKG